VYPVRIERSRVLSSGAIAGKPTERIFQQRECQALSAQQTARDKSKQAPALTRCEKNALTVHRAIAKAFRVKHKGKTRS